MIGFRMAWALVALGVAVGASMGCQPQIDVATWSEEVKFHDGSQRLIQRVARAHPRPLLSETRGSDIDFELHDPGLGIHWRGTRSSVAFEVFDGVGFVVTAVASPVGFCKGKPTSTLPIRVFKQHGPEWVEIPSEDFPMDMAFHNLYRHYWGNKPSEDASGTVTWDHKAGMDAYPFVKGVGSARRSRTLSEFYRDNHLTCARFVSG